jgi:glycosyltransferase involved in cell wall biosynthesis
VLNNKKFYERWKDELSKKSRSGENVFFERDQTQNKKHVLVVDHYLPTIDKDAGSRTISNFIDSLLALDYSVKFLGENQNIGIQYQIHFQKKGVEVLYGSPYNFFDQSWKNYLRAHHADFDAILLSRSSVCTPILAYLRTLNYKGNIIYYGHDLGFLRMEKEAEVKNDPELRRQAVQVKAQEDYMYMNSDNALIINDDEARYLKQYIDVPLHYVPPYFFDVQEVVNPFAAREGVLFVGGFNHPPNREAVTWFMGQVYGDLAKQGIPLVIAGSKVPPAFYDYEKKYPSVRICADVSDEELNRLYANTRIAIVPLLFGAGVKGKVIESMAKGVPIVGTEIAFEGMPKDNGYKYKGINSASEFSSAVLSLYHDDRLWNELSQFGRKYVQEHFNRENMRSVFKKLIG